MWCGKSLLSETVDVDYSFNFVSFLLRIWAERRKSKNTISMLVMAIHCLRRCRCHHDDNNHRHHHHYHHHYNCHFLLVNKTSAAARLWRIFLLEIAKVSGKCPLSMPFMLNDLFSLGQTTYVNGQTNEWASSRHTDTHKFVHSFAAMCSQTRNDVFVKQINYARGW